MARTTNINRRTLVVGGATLTLTAAVTPLWAASHAKEGGEAMQTADVSGVSRQTVGEHEVIAFLDGRIQLPASALSGAPDEEIRKLMGGDSFGAYINAFLVRGSDETVLIDTGAGQMMGSASGRLDAHMREIGIDPSTIDTILATHLHPDHIGGIVGAGELVTPDTKLVVHENEVAFWTSEENKAAAGESNAQFFDAARSALDAFGDRVERISGETDVAGSMRSMELFGHTPGHTGFMLDSGGEQMLVWGDIIHVPPVQFAEPQVTIGFDVNPEEAAATRQRVLDMVTADGVPVAGMHLAFPAMGMITRSADGYGFETMG